MFLPFAEKPFTGSVKFLSNRKGRWAAARRCSKSSCRIWSGIRYSTTRALLLNLDRKPVPFSQYSFPLLKFSRENNFEYQYQPWPAARGGSAA